MIRQRVLAIGSLLLAAVALRGSAGEPSRPTQPERDFLARAAGAIQAVQARAKTDVTLHPFAEAKLERGENPMVMPEAPILDKGMPTFRAHVAKGRFVVFSVKTAEVWDGFPTKVPYGAAPRVRGHGYLTIGVYENLPGKLACTPFMPPQGCYGGSTYLSIPGTPAKVHVDTLTSDRKANQRLVDMVVEELAKVGIRAVPPKNDMEPQPVTSLGPSPAIVPPPKTNTGQPPALQPRPPQR